MNLFVLAILILILYLMIGVIVQRVLLKFTKLHPIDVSAISTLWILFLPVWSFLSILKFIYNKFIILIDKYLDRFGDKK